MITLSEVERAACRPFGSAAGFSLPEDEGLAIADALRSTLREALIGGTCLISFSGGRDSSILLALAIQLARDEGHDLPIPVTLRFPGRRYTEETSFQQVVIDHLGVKNWEQMTVGDELDYLGDISQRILRKHGAGCPENAHFLVPMTRAASDGTIVTGLDGDSLFDGWEYAELSGLLAGGLPTVRAMRVAPRAAAPRALRRQFFLRRRQQYLDWLTPEGRAAVRSAMADEFADHPVLWNERVRWWAGLRLVRAMVERVAVSLDGTGWSASHPLLEPQFLHAVARRGGRSGFPDRTAAFNALFDGVLPSWILSRTHKADFGEVFWTDRTDEWVRAWDGEGADTRLVDLAGLRRDWANGRLAASVLQLQLAWLRSSGVGCAEHGIDRLAQEGPLPGSA